MSGTTTVTVKWAGAMAEVSQADWDRLALPLATPFLEWEWLHQLEASGSIAPETGWLPRHLTVRAGGRLVGAAPLYVKGHSQGEFVFDHAWAEVAARLGIRYYPKLVGMTPVTPVVGYRFLTAPDADARFVTRVMLEAIDRLCGDHGLSGCSFLFCDPQWARGVAEHGLFEWLHQSYAWENPGYRDFSDYLEVFNANQRRNIRRERRAMETAGIELAALAGDEIPAELVSLMVRYYQDTNDRYGPWGCKYLTPAFFQGVHARYRRRLVFMSATRRAESPEPLALALLVHKGDRLYGRYWGCRRSLNALHFNTCYYAPIEWAIRGRIRIFDPGAGSNHKLRRGFQAVGNTSLYRFRDPRMARIMALHMDEINALEQGRIDELNRCLPFSRSGPAGSGGRGEAREQA